MESFSWNRGRVCLVAGALALFCSDGALGDEPPKSWFQLITINAFASASYTWNFNNPPTNLNQYRAFDYDSNSIRIDAAEIVVQKAVANRGDFGFRIDIAMGAVAKVAAARGLFRDPVTGVAGDFDLQQAFASYIAPLGKGLRIDVGKFVTPVGTEFIDGYDGYNDNFSRSLLFTLAIPFTHTGLKLTYAFNDKIAATVMLVNGWDNVLDNNSAKSFGVSIALTRWRRWPSISTTSAGPSRITTTRTFAASSTSASSTSRRRAGRCRSTAIGRSIPTPSSPLRSCRRR
jgi:hypothetical protein